ncbi:hypothetical protein B296_00023142 [Ensete ventricosum]|uniref:Uncharacterized protein n=1 Tax=Ensete ventricosum TaxID=4639 RepID=A0A426XAA6_ENSVE|nr:hypothetical protein B296_00023142 [Ensete ventricosum]
MDSHNNTSEEATSARGTRSVADQASEVEMTGCTSSVRLSHIPRDDNGKVGHTDKLSSPETSMILPTPNHYWRLFNDLGLTTLDPGLSPTPSGLGLPVMTTEAFLGLT